MTPMSKRDRYREDERIVSEYGWRELPCFSYGRPILLRCICVLVFMALSAWSEAACRIKPESRALPSAQANELFIATQNLWQLRDTHPDTSADQPVTQEYLDERLKAITAYVAEQLRWPHLLALQEVENLAVLAQLGQRIAQAGGPVYDAYLIDGLDPSGIDVALLTRAPVRVKNVEELFRERRHNRGPLFSRPPLLVTVDAPLAMKIVVVHLRSGRDLNDERKGESVRQKRRSQAEVLRAWVERESAGEVPLVIIGDLNSADGDPLYAEPLRIIERAPLWSVWEALPETERFSYVYRCRPQAIDSILVSESLRQRIRRAEVSRGNAGYQYRLYKKKFPYLVSDHDALGVYLRIEQTK